MNNLKTIKVYTCCKCLNNIEKMTDKEPNPLFLCSSCVQEDVYKHHIIVEVKGAPAGKVKGTHNPLRTRNTKEAYKK